MSSTDMSKEEKLNAANEARKEVKELLCHAKEGRPDGVLSFISKYLSKHSTPDHIITEADVLISIRDGNGRTALHFAASEGHTSVVDTILGRAPAAVDVQDDRGLTALALAFITGHVTTAGRLAQLGANVNLKDSENVAPTHRAAGH
ncbi:unnamed protein product, partial [Choristocarpus tenellus]